MAQAASTAFPPWLKIVAPAVAARGFPVMAIQFLPWMTGFCVFCARVERLTVKSRMMAVGFMMECYLILMNLEFPQLIIKNRNVSRKNDKWQTIILHGSEPD
jgi:hypothetical protein